jgi:hypothetical protein
LTKRQRHPASPAVEQATLLLRAIYASARLVYEYPTLTVGECTFRCDIAVFVKKVLVAVVEVGTLNGGPTRLTHFAEVWPGVRVIWIPHCDLYPDCDRYRIRQTDLVSVDARTGWNETIRALRSEISQLRQEKDRLIEQRDRWKRDAHQSQSDVRWNTWLDQRRQALEGRICPTCGQ